LGTHVAHPGVSSYVDKEDQVRYHSYYQWVPFMLFFQGIMFYVPHWLWKNWEEGKIRMITDGVRGASLGQTEDRINRQKQLVQYLIDTLHMHNVYASGYFLCEVSIFYVHICSLCSVHKINEHLFRFLDIQFSERDRKHVPY